MENKTVILGLDGLDPSIVGRYRDRDKWDELDIESVAHTCPSWNAIFSGNINDDVVDFWKIPDEYDGGTVAGESSEKWRYDELFPDDYVWERDGVDVEVVSAPVVLPTFSTLDNPPGAESTWTSEPGEVAPAIRELTEMTLEQEKVITVMPFPDKMHHMLAGNNKYTTMDFDTHIGLLFEKMDRIIEEFDEYLIISDHGEPSAPEFVRPKLKVASHRPTGVIQSNVADTEGYTNGTVANLIEEILR